MLERFNFRFSKKSLGGTFIVGLGAAISAASCSSDESEPIARVSEALTANLQEGVNGYVGTTDTDIQQGAATTNNGAATTCDADGDDGGGNDKSCLIRWGITGIPSVATVTSATITLNAVDSSSNTYNVYALNRTWNESQATWNVAQSGTNWGTPGAMAASDRGAVIGTVTGSGSRTITLNAAGIALVQSWVSGGTNAGIIIASTSNSNGIDFASSEHGTAGSRPRLTINYTEPGGSAGAGGTAGTAGTAGSAGKAGSAGAGNTGNTGGGGATDPNLLVAFIGDQGANSNSTAVMQLIENEGAAAVVHAGDFDYGNNPTGWDDRITSVLGANYPYFATVGNHDGPSWNGTNGYGAKIAARQSRVPSMQCTGDPGVKQTCNFRGLRLVQTCVGTSEVTGHGSCGSNSSEQINFINAELAADTSIWSVCSFHKNQNDMQVGTKGNEVGWNAYTACMNGGGIVATGHEHSYSRTFTLTNLGNTAAGHGKTGTPDILEVAPGRTFVFVSGLAGNSVRPFDTSTHNDDTWWASYTTSDRWLRNGVMQSGGGTHGALFIRFNVNGNPRQASGYFKEITGRIVDTFTINAP